MAKLYINGYIGDSNDFFGSVGFSLANLNNFIDNDLKDDKKLTIEINSGGGYVTEGFAIYDRLQALKADGVTITTVCAGLTGSIATVIYLAGDVRRMYENSEFFIHNPMFCPTDWSYTADELTAITQDLMVSQDKIVNLYTSITGADAAALAPLLEAETNLSADRAKELGFVTEIINTKITALTRYKLVALSNPQTKEQPMSKELTAVKEDVGVLKTLVNTLTGTVNDFVAAFKKGTKVAASVEAGDVTLYFEGEGTPAMGTKVFTDPEMTTPAADGSYGDITVKDGAVAEKEEEVDEVAALKETVATATETITALTEQVVAMKKEMETLNLGDGKPPRGTRTPGEKQTLSAWDKMAINIKTQTRK